MSTEAKQYAKRVRTEHQDLAFNDGWVVESILNNAHENEHEEVIAYVDTEALADCLLRGLTSQAGPFEAEKMYDIVSPVKPEVLIVVEGGCVISVLSTTPAIEVTLVDYDDHDREYEPPDLDSYPHELPLS